MIDETDRFEHEQERELEFYDTVQEFLLSETGKLFLGWMLRENSDLLEIAQRVIDEKINEMEAIKYDVYSGQAHSDLECDVPADVLQMVEDTQFLNKII